MGNTGDHIRGFAHRMTYEEYEELEDTVTEMFRHKKEGDSIQHGGVPAGDKSNAERGRIKVIDRSNGWSITFFIGALFSAESLGYNVKVTILIKAIINYRRNVWNLLWGR